MQQREIGILWDLDGTLVDTQQAHFDTWHAALLTVGVDLPRHTFDQNFGRNNAESLPNYLGYKPDAALAARLSDLKEALFIEQAAETAPLFDGVITWLDYFKGQGYHQAIASSAPMQNIDVVVDARGYPPLFPGTAVPAQSCPPSLPRIYSSRQRMRWVLPPGIASSLRMPPPGWQRAGTRV